MGIIKSLLLEPLITAPLLAILTLGPSQLQTPMLDLLAKQTLVTPKATANTLSAFLVLGILRKLNSFFTHWANKNFILSQSQKWDFSTRGRELAVVTGGSNGIGQAIVREFISKGVRVVVLDVLPPPKELEASDLVEYQMCDLSHPGDIKKATDEIKENFGDPTILINNAGISGSRTILTVPMERLQKIFSVNLLSHWALAQAFLPAMIEMDKGHVVSMASLSSFVTIPDGVAYSATKSGLLSFHEGLTVELALVHEKKGVLTTVVHPHWVKTGLIKPLVESIEKKQGKLLSAEEVAKTVTERVFSATGGQVLIPEQYDIIAGLRGWPSWMGVLVRTALGRTAAGQTRQE